MQNDGMFGLPVGYAFNFVRAMDGWPKLHEAGRGGWEPATQGRTSHREVIGATNNWK